MASGTERRQQGSRADETCTLITGGACGISVGEVEGLAYSTIP